MYKSIIKLALCALFLTLVFQRCKVQYEQTNHLKIKIMPKKETQNKRWNEKEIVFPTIRNKYNFTNQYEEVDPTVMVVQGESYSIQELISKHSAGISPDIAKTPIWDDEANHNSLDYMKVESMDLSEQQMYLEDARELVKQAEAAVAESKKIAEEAEKQRVSQETSEKTEEKE